MRRRTTLWWRKRLVQRWLTQLASPLLTGQYSADSEEAAGARAGRCQPTKMNKQTLDLMKRRTKTMKRKRQRKKKRWSKILKRKKKRRRKRKIMKWKTRWMTRGR